MLHFMVAELQLSAATGIFPPPLPDAGLSTQSPGSEGTWLSEPEEELRVCNFTKATEAVGWEQQQGTNSLSQSDYSCEPVGVMPTNILGLRKHHAPSTLFTSQKAGMRVPSMMTL